MKQLCYSCCLSLAVSWIASPLQAGLLLHYSFDESPSNNYWTDPTATSPALVPDSSGNGLNGLFRDGNSNLDANKHVSPVTPAALGGAWNFGGNTNALRNDVVEIQYGSLPAGAQDALTGNSARSVSVWLDPVTYGDQRFFGYAGAGAANPGAFVGLTVETTNAADPDNNAVVRFRRGGGMETYTPTQAPNPFSVAGLVHVAFVVPNGAVNTQDALVYVNGALATHSSSGADQALITGSTPNTMAANDYVGVGRAGANAGVAGGNATGFEGLIGDFQLYDMALTADQVSFLYNNPGVAIPEPSSWMLLGFGVLSFRVAFNFSFRGRHR